MLLALPAGNGSLSVADYTNFQTFSANGLDIGMLQGGYDTTKSVPYN